MSNLGRIATTAPRSTPPVATSKRTCTAPASRAEAINLSRAGHGVGCVTDLVEGAVAMVKSIRLALGIIVVTAGACTVAKNTSAQDLAWERWEKCKQSGVNLRRIEPNGRIWVTYAADHGLALREFQECDR